MKLVLKKKPLPVEAIAVDTLSELAEAIDLVGTLQMNAVQVLAAIADLTETLKPLKDAKTDLQAKINALGGDDDLIEEVGEYFILTAGKRATSRSISNLPEAKKMLGNELFMKLATITLKNLDDYLTPPQKELVLSTARTGRTMKIVRRAVADTA